jgi:hypothetical protein
MRCEECEDFEFRRAHPIRWIVYRALTERYRSPFPNVAAIMLAAMGGKVATHYERHRDEFARTGDPVELDRMLRQVE